MSCIANETNSTYSQSSFSCDSMSTSFSPDRISPRTACYCSIAPQVDGLSQYMGEPVLPLSGELLADICMQLSHFPPCGHLTFTEVSPRWTQQFLPVRAAGRHPRSSRSGPAGYSLCYNKSEVSRGSKQVGDTIRDGLMRPCVELVGSGRHCSRHNRDGSRGDTYTTVINEMYVSTHLGWMVPFIGSGTIWFSSLERRGVKLSLPLGVGGSAVDKLGVEGVLGYFEAAEI